VETNKGKEADKSVMREISRRKNLKYIVNVALA